MDRELISLLQREMQKLETVFSSVRPKSGFEDAFELARSYWEDCKYFCEKGDKIKAFELVNYVWGMLDCLARLNGLEIPKDIRQWFKIEPTE